MAEPLFELKNLSFSSKNNSIIHDTNLTIERGTTTIIQGESGSGKSTMLKLIAGIFVPSGGKVLYNGYDIQTMSAQQNEEFRKKSAFVFQNSALWANQDILQNVSLPLQTHFPKMTTYERIRRVKEMCTSRGYARALTLRPSDLSIGEQKKIAIARALITSPEILFLDECTESLGRSASEIVIDILKDFCSQGKTLIYASHSIHFRNNLPGKEYIIDKGILISENEPGLKNSGTQDEI